MISIKNHKTLGTQGFTLIEMLVVIGIIVMMSAIAMPNISSYFQLSLNGATRDIAGTVKEAYNSAIVTGQVYRVAYDLKAQSYWVESGPSNVLLHIKETKEKDLRRHKFDRKTEKEPPSEFKLETSITRKKRTLPTGVEFEDVVTQQTQTPIIEGTAYTHIFPHGLSEQTIIHLKDSSKHQASLVITPLLGMTDLYNNYVKGQDVFGKD